MPPAIELVEMPATVIASVRRRVAWSDLQRIVPQLLGNVWQFLRSSEVRRAGNHVTIYRAPNADSIEVECGVQISAPFAGDAQIACSATPAGLSAHVVHLGAYGGLTKAHEALFDFCRTRGLRSGIHWDVYGEWTADPSSLRTDVYSRAVTPHVLNGTAESAYLIGEET
jgi:effector-binding domain-containing protein